MSVYVQVELRQNFPLPPHELIVGHRHKQTDLLGASACQHGFLFFQQVLILIEAEQLHHIGILQGDLPQLQQQVGELRQGVDVDGDLVAPAQLYLLLELIYILRRLFDPVVQD